MVTCSKCTGENPEGHRFCGSCGASLETPTSAPTRTNTEGDDGVSSLPSLETPRFSPGTVLAKRYRIVGLLGRGGMGEVYRADDLKLGQPVALKFLPAEVEKDRARLDRFLNEVKIARQVAHPNVCRVYDVGEFEGQHYLSMEYVDGEDLASLLRRIGRLPHDKAVEIARQICAGLAWAHDKRVIHRDIKTANIMWTRDRKTKIMDFGLAKVVEEVRNHTTVVSGTPYYMSPEQTLGKNVDHRTDIYSLGVTMFEMATATLPFREGNLPYHHVHTAPPDPREFNAELPAVLVKIIARCLEKDPADRYQSCREIADELQSAVQGADGTSRPSS